MNLSEPFIRRPVMTTLVMIAILCVGLLAYYRLPVSDLPDVEYPTLEVSAYLPGGSPKTMADTVATPLERAFMAINGIRVMTSSSTQGASTIVLQFDLSVNIDAAAQDVNAAISATLPLLPQMPSNPTYEKVNPSAAPIQYMVVSSPTMEPDKLYEYADSYVGKRLSMVPGVAQIITYGSPYAVRVRIDPQNLAAKGLDLTNIATTIAGGNVNYPLGDYDGVLRYFLIQNPNGQILRAEGYDNLVISTQNGAPLSIRDVGYAINSQQQPYLYCNYVNASRGINQPTAVIAVQKQPKANTIEVVKGIDQLLPHLRKEIPANIYFDSIFNRADSIIASVKDVEFTLLVAFILVVAVIFIYLGKFKDTIIPVVVIPMSMISTFMLMDLAGFTLDNLSLMALLLAIGFIIDDAIVVLENIVRHIEGGKPPYKAALDGSAQISITVMTMTLALCAVFIPLLFLSGMLGRLFREFAVTMVMAIMSSGVISLTLTPLLCSRFLPPHKKSDEDNKVHFSEKINRTLIKGYRKGLEWVLVWPKLTLVIGLAALIGTVFVFQKLPTSLTASDDLGFLIAYTQTAQNSSTRHSVELQQEVNKEFTDNKHIVDYVTLAGLSNNSGLLFARLKPANERPSVQHVLQDLNVDLWQIPGIATYVKALPFLNLSVGATSNADYQYVLSSLNPEDLYSAATKLTQRLQMVPGFINVNNDLQNTTPQIELTLDRDAASSYGISAQALQSNLGYALSGGKVSTMQTPANEYNVVLEVTPSYSNQPDNLNALYIQNPSAPGNVVPLSNILQMKEGVGVSSVNHFNQFPSVTLSFSLAPQIPLSDAISTLRGIADEVLPQSVNGDLQGVAQQFEETMSDFRFLIIIAVIFIYILLGILYESFILPLTILSALPIAVLGGLLTLLAFDQILSLYALLGLVLLIGIVQKNGIMMIDYANEMKKNGKGAHDAIFEAALIRFRPILMTTLAAIMGALPVAVGLGAGGEARKPLGLVLIGGLLFSQLLTLFLMPVVFIYLDRLQPKIKDMDASI